MEKVQAKGLVERTFNNRFNKENFRTFIINFLDGINESKAFSVGQAQVKEAFQKYILSYQRIGQYTDSDGNIIDALIVHLNDKCSLDRNRTMLRNFVADYMRTRGKENTLVAFYNDTIADWRFSFVKLDISSFAKSTISLSFNISLAVSISESTVLYFSYISTV